MYVPSVSVCLYLQFQRTARQLAIQGDHTKVVQVLQKAEATADPKAQDEVRHRCRVFHHLCTNKCSLMNYHVIRLYTGYPL